MSVILIIAYIISGIIIGLMTVSLAEGKGYKSAGYFWLGFFLSVIGLIYVAGLSVSRKRISEEQEQLAALIAKRLQNNDISENMDWKAKQEDDNNERPLRVDEKLNTKDDTRRKYEVYC